MEQEQNNSKNNGYGNGNGNGNGNGKSDSSGHRGVALGADRALSVIVRGLVCMSLAESCSLRAIGAGRSFVMSAGVSG
ncbi:hypothetical protein [Xanthomonas sacchari]|uniref:hypothetical protein n=1 Tax=Xanthomonas sacchari TaxID=56458 RepID=UPI003527D46A